MDRELVLRARGGDVEAFDQLARAAFLRLKDVACQWTVPQSSARTRSRGSRSGIVWSGEDGLIEENAVEGGRNGIIIGGGSPTVAGNDVQGMEGRGLVVMGIASPTLTDNSVCGNEQDLHVGDKAAPAIEAGNEICEDAATE